MSKTVLLVDDEADIREVAQISLEMVAGWQVHTAASGRDGLEAAVTYQPDAILLDVMMPDLDGPSVVAQLQQRKATSDIPVIFLTAKAQASEREHLAALGVAGVLSKPFDPMALPNAIATILGWSG